MATLIVRDKSAIKKYNGGKIYVKEVEEDGTDLGTPDTFTDIGYVQESSILDTRDKEEERDESNAVVSTSDTNRSVIFSGLLMQSDLKTLDFLSKNCESKFYAVYYLSAENIQSAEVQEIAFGICEIKPNLELVSGTRRPPFEITALKNEAEITISALPAIATATSFVIAAGGYYQIEQGA